MRLNMTILADELEGLCITDKRLGDAYALPLVGAQLWRPAAIADASTVYVTTPESLPPLQTGQHLSLVCIGMLPDKYRTSPRVDFVELPSACDPVDALNHVSAAFARLSDWNARLQAACLAHATLDEVATIAFEELDNNFCCYDSQNYMLFFVHKPDDPYAHLYPEANSYLPADEGDLIRENAAYEKVMFSRFPTLMPNSEYDTDTLVGNIFDESTLVARLTVDETQRPFKQSDYVLLWYACGIMREVILKWNLLRVGTSLALSSTIESLVEQDGAYGTEHDRALASIGWNRDDVYKVLAIVPREGRFDERNVAQIELFIQRHIENVCTSGNARRILAVINIGRRRGAPERDELIDRYLETNDLLCGMSREFRGFERIKRFYRQAWETLEAGRTAGASGPAFQFDDFALDILLSNSSGEFRPEDYVIPQLHAIATYDREHDGELMRTLVTYIKGAMNVTASINRLHVHKTTFYYRLRRIEEISGLSLEDYRTVLYLMIVFETVPEFSELSLA